MSISRQEYDEGGLPTVCTRCDEPITGEAYHGHCDDCCQAEYEAAFLCDLDYCGASAGIADRYCPRHMASLRAGLLSVAS